MSLKRILVAVDGSEFAKKAVRVAADIASARSAELVLLHVKSLPVAYAAGEFYVPSDQVEESVRKEGERILQEAAQEAQGFGVKPKTVMQDHIESVVQTILQYAEKEQVDLIVVGTRGLGGFKKLLLGSVASGLVSYAHCSVLIVK